MSKPDPLRELARLTRVADPDGRNIGTHLRQRARELAPLLGVPESDLLAAAQQPDEILAPKVLSTLKRLQQGQAAAHGALHSARAVEAAQVLQAGARWQEGAVALEPALVLGELLADQGRPHILFAFPDGHDVAVQRRDLVATARTIGRRTDLETLVDHAGFHVRWSGGRGGLNWYPRHITRAERDLAVRVELPGPVPAPTPSRPTPRARSWTWDVMADLGFAT